MRIDSVDQNGEHERSMPYIHLVLEHEVPPRPEEVAERADGPQPRSTGTSTTWANSGGQQYPA